MRSLEIELNPCSGSSAGSGGKGICSAESEVPPLKYVDCDNRPGRPTGAQLRKLEAMFVNINGYADTNPDEAFRKFLERRFEVSHARLLDDRKFESALTAVKRLQAERGVKKVWKG